MENGKRKQEERHKKFKCQRFRFHALAAYIHKFVGTSKQYRLHPYSNLCCTVPKEKRKMFSTCGSTAQQWGDVTLKLDAVVKKHNCIITVQSCSKTHFGTECKCKSQCCETKQMKLKIFFTSSFFPVPVFSH